MNKPFYILFFVFLLSMFQYSSSHAQTNLIYNGDFELYDTCPTGVGQLNYCTGWLNPTVATPDYFNTCNTSTVSVSIPSNVVGFQNPYSGNGYAGFIAFEYVFPDWWFEYLQGKFVQPLTAGHLYEISFYVSCGEGYADIAISKIGAYASTLPISRADALPFFVTPQIINTSGIITDTANWTKISGTFVASGNEKFITIGYFSDTLITDSLRIQTFPFGSPLSPRTYYYVDGITATDISGEEIIPNIFSPNGDGINDFFDLNFVANFSSVEIYNRWGIKVFESNKLQNKWDGRTTSGEICNDGTYYYLIKVNEQDNSSKDLKGFIQLVR